MEALSSLESLLLAGLIAAALVVALFGIRKSVVVPDGSPRTGEIVWSLVALAVLAGVSLAAGLGGPHGG